MKDNLRWRHEPEKLLDGHHVAGRMPKVVDATGFVVAQVYRGGLTKDGADPKAEAIAQLLSAAPDLLAACRYMLEHFEKEAASKMAGPYWTDGRNMARAAIAKAESR